MEDLVSRVNKTVSCKDSEYIPKCADAGKVVGGYQIMHNGLKVVTGCYHGQWMTDLITRCNGHHEPQEEKAFYEVLKYIKPGSCMIEVGSFWAYYSMWFNKEVPDAVNHMIDISEYYVGIGSTNFQLNNLYGNFYVGSVPSFSIDEFIKQENIDHIHLLHSDIQGHELELLEGSNNSFDKIDYMFISTHSNELHTKCLDFITKKGFIILCEHNLDQAYAADGLIVAKNPLIDTDFTKISISK